MTKLHKCFHWTESHFELWTVLGSRFIHPGTLLWCHNECDGTSNHQHLDCLLKCLLKLRSKKASKPHITGLCEGNPAVTSGLPSQRTSNAENVSIWWRHHELTKATGNHEWKLSGIWPELCGAEYHQFLIKATWKDILEAYMAWLDDR